jgi:hypothetical protein
MAASEPKLDSVSATLKIMEFFNRTNILMQAMKDETPTYKIIELRRKSRDRMAGRLRDFMGESEDVQLRRFAATGAIFIRSLDEDVMLDHLANLATLANQETDDDYC